MCETFSSELALRLLHRQNERTSDHEHVDLRREERVNRFRGCANYRLSTDIKRRVQQNRHSAYLSELMQEPPKTWVILFRHGLDPRGSVDVGSRRQLITISRPNLGDEQHMGVC